MTTAPSRGPSGRSFASRAAAVLALSSLAALAPSGLALAASGQVAAYGFGEGAGTTTADASGNGLTGVLVGGPAWVAGRSGTALRFNGSSSYVDLGSPAVLRLTGSMTLSAWVNEAANVGDDGQIVAMSDGGSGWQLKSSPDTGVRTFAVAISNSAGAPVQRYSRTVRALGTWYHVAGVYDAAARTLHIYVNGVLDDGVLSGTVPAAQLASTVNANIGRRGGGFTIDGTVDDVRLYARALTGAEIVADMGTPVGAPALAFDFSLASGGARSVGAGGSVSNPITATLVSGATQAVSFTASGLPAGASASFGPASCSPSCATTLTIATSAATPAGTSTVTLTGAAAGLSRTTSFQLLVTTAADLTPPVGTVVINGGAAATNSRTVTLSLAAVDTQSAVTQMRLSSDGTSWLAAEAYATTRSWTLSIGSGTKSVFVQFKDAAGNWSATASDTIVLDTTAPTISAVASTSITPSSATIGWTTSEPATSQVDYGVTSAYGSSTPLDSSLVTSHAVVLTGLVQATIYDYRVRSRDAAGNLRLGSNATFATTAGPDTTPPSAPTNLSALAASPTQVNLAWSASTDDVGVTGYAVLRNGAQVGTSTGPSFTDAGLSPGSTSTYVVTARDGAGNVSAPSAPATVSTPSAANLGVPTLVQHVGSTTLLPSRGILGNHLKFTLPNPVLPGNCLILGVAFTSGTAFAATPITDSSGNSWPLTPAASVVDGASNTDLAIFVLPSANPGVTTVTVHFAAAIPQFQYSISEFYGIASAAPLNGSSRASRVVAPSLSTGAFTPGNNDAAGGNLIWSYFFDDSDFGSGNEVTTFTPGPGFALLDADLAWHRDSNVHHATEYLVQATAAPINPGLTAAMSPSSDTFVGLSIALRAGPAGTAPAPPSAGIRIARILHQTNEVPPATLVAQAPSSGNLILFTTANASGFGNIASITDNKGNAYTKIQPDGSEPQFFVAANAITGNDLQLTIHFSAAASGMSFSIFDIVGARAAPIGAIGHLPATGCSSVTSISDAPSITPTAPGGLTVAVMGIGQGPGTGLDLGAPAGAIFDLATYAGETDLDTMENADARAHLYNTDTATEHWNWALTSIPNNSCFAVAVNLLGP